jgi:hypothetical protein
MSRPSGLSIAEVPVALLAGGLGTRLGPISATTPKTMVTVAGRPFIDHQLALLLRNGIRRVVLCLGHLGEQVEAHPGNGRALGMDLRYDNVSELTAWTNDAGWDTVFVNWLRGSRLTANDMVFVLSVGGGDLERNVSPNLVRARQYARSVEATICGIVGHDGGSTAQVADACVIVPTVNPENITPHSEAIQAVIWHLFVSHPALKALNTRWESIR